MAAQKAVYRVAEKVQTVADEKAAKTASITKWHYRNKRKKRKNRPSLLFHT
jgi:hypothetical protein